MIWRRLLVRGDSTVADLHYTLQIAMCWTDTHLHRFRIHGKDHGVAHPGGIFFADDPERVRLAEFGFRSREHFFYEYDFGDFWEHEIRVERILEVDPNLAYPLCIAGNRAGPPEGCGGPRGFFELARQAPGALRREMMELAEALETRDLEAIRDGMERLESLRPWLALDRFDRRDVNRRLGQYARGEREELFALVLD
jgi:hypothetical protein